MARSASFLASLAVILSAATVTAAIHKDGFRFLVMGTGAATTAALAGAVVADSSAARRRTRN